MTARLLNIEVLRVSSDLPRMKPLLWMGSSKADLRAFPPEARRKAGRELADLQYGGDPADWKPMASIGAGVREIRVRDAAGAFRVVYLANRPESVYVLHCFRKKGRKTSRQDIALAKARFKEIPKAEEGSDEGR